MGRRGFVVVLLAVVPAAGCGASSSAPRATQTTTTTRRAVPVAVPSPRAAAIALSHRLLGEAVLPVGARRTDAHLPKLMRGAWVQPAGRNVVGTSQAFVVSASPDALLAFVERHAPRGLVGAGKGSLSSRTERVDFVTDKLVLVPANITEAGVEIGVEPQGDGSLVNVIAGAQWTPVRPSAELAGASDPVVSIRVLEFDQPGVPAIRRVVETGASADALTRAFNALRVAPVGAVGGCPAIGPGSISYEISFAPSAGARAAIRADRGPCGPVAVRVGGGRGLSLDTSRAFDAAIAHALGLSKLAFFR